jgi:hypothetical protein
MAPLKTPGPDGLPAGFYQNHWSDIGVDISEAVLEVLNSGIMPSSLNLTYTALIPKVKNPLCVNEFQPISLCNVLYKLISKVLANRLKRILNSIISPTQSAFMPGRLITDNILAAYEKRKEKEKTKVARASWVRPDTQTHGVKSTKPISLLHRPKNNPINITIVLHRPIKNANQYHQSSTQTQK